MVTLKVPENGLISVNVPLDPLRLGALSTRTTHPFYIARWNDVLTTLGVNVRIENPYWDKTKGEMVKVALRGLAPKTHAVLALVRVSGKGPLAGHRDPALRLLRAVPDPSCGPIGGPKA